MKYYYAKRYTKNGDTLITSYTKEADQKKYGGADASFSTGVKGVTFDVNGKISYNDEGEGFVLRSYMRAVERQETSQGKFLILGATNDVWSETGFRFGTYGAANAVMKQIAPLYDAVIIVEETPNESKPKVQHEEDKSAPF